MTVQLNQEALAGLVASIVQRPMETSASELIGLLELGLVDGVLGQISVLQDVLEMYRMELVPPLTVGEIQSPRLLKFKKTLNILTTEALIGEVQLGESSFREFKSSLFFDVQRAINDPGKPPATYRSPAVLFSCLKAVCAFLNGDGGLLFVGIKDDGVACGLGNDFQLAECSSVDRWESYFRNNVRGRFHDGAVVNDYVDFSFVDWDGATVAQVNVTARKRLSLLKDDTGNFVVYRRQGNRSEPLPLPEIEEFLRSKWGLDR